MFLAVMTTKQRRAVTLLTCEKGEGAVCVCFDFVSLVAASLNLPSLSWFPERPSEQTVRICMHKADGATGFHASASH